MTAFGIKIDTNAVCILPPGASKHDALDMLIDALAEDERITNHEALREAVYERESIMSTGIGSGVAIPHVRIDEVLQPMVGVGVSREGIDFQTLDDGPVKIIVLFAMPSGTHKTYLNLLAQVMASLKAPGFCDTLLACDSPEAIVEALS